MARTNRPKNSTAQHAAKPVPAPKSYIIYVLLVIVLVTLAVLVAVGEGASTPLQRCKGTWLGSNRDACFEALALDNDNATVCSYIKQPGRDSCIQTLAETRLSLTDCRLMSSNAAGQNCTAHVAEESLNLTACGALGSAYQSGCAYTIAAMQNFSVSSTCYTIQNTSLQTRCTYMHDYTDALVRRDLSACALLPAQPDAGLVAALSTSYNGISASDALINQFNFSARDYCYYRSAIAYNNATTCSRINASYGSVFCHAVLANFTYAYNLTVNATNATQLCGSVPQEFRGICELSLPIANAVQTKNVTVCLDLANTSMRYSCVATLATTYDQNQYCNYINNASLKTGCYLSVNQSKGSR